MDQVPLKDVHVARIVRACNDWASEAAAAGDPLAWYERLYAGAAPGDIPWDHGEPTPYLADWLLERFPGTTRRGRAVVIGCAYGDDAELLVQHGFDVTGFDISVSAIDAARQRHPNSSVHYQQADLLDLPADWRYAFDLVVECTTLQCLPVSYHRAAAASVAFLCARDGLVLVIARVPQPNDPPGPPWLLEKSEIRQIETDGLKLTKLEALKMRGGARWIAELTRPAAPSTQLSDFPSPVQRSDEIV